MPGPISQAEYQDREEAKGDEMREQLRALDRDADAGRAEVEALDLSATFRSVGRAKFEAVKQATRIATKRTALSTAREWLATWRAIVEDQRLDALLGPDGKAEFGRTDAELLASMSAAERVRATTPDAVRERRRAFAEKYRDQPRPTPAETPSGSLAAPSEHAAKAGEGCDHQPTAPTRSAPAELSSNLSTVKGVPDAGAVDQIPDDVREAIERELRAAGLPADDATVRELWEAQQ